MKRDDGAQVLSLGCWHGVISRAGARLIRARLRERGLSQEDLARSMGVSPSELSRWINGRRRISEPQLTQVCDELGLGLDGFLNERER